MNGARSMPCLPVSTGHARRYAVVPLLRQEPVGVDRLLELATGHRQVTEEA